jgi:hypothetical protein
MKLTRKKLKSLSRRVESLKYYHANPKRSLLTVIELERLVSRNLSHPFSNFAWLLKQAYARRMDDLNYEYPKTLLVAEEQITNETNKEKPKKIWHHYIS